MAVTSNCPALVAVAAIAIALAFVGCQNPAHGGSQAKGPIPVLNPEKASAAGLSSQELGNASRLCATKCVRCHKFYNPAAYSDSEWQRWMQKMSRKAKLNPAQEQLLSRYLGAFR